MVLILLAALIAILSVRSAGGLTDDVREGIGGLTNALGFASAVLNGIRKLDDWRRSRVGHGPYNLGGLDTGYSSTQVLPRVRRDPYENDPIGKQLGLPPRVDVSRPAFDSRVAMAGLST